jgi:hypothetical protein
MLSTELKIIQQRLRPPITLTEMAAIQNYLRQAIELVSQVASPDEQLWNEAVRPLTNALTNTQSPVQNQQTQQTLQTQQPPHYDEPSSAEIDLNLHSSANINITDLKNAYYHQSTGHEQLAKSSESAQLGNDEHPSPHTALEFEQQQNNLMTSVVDAMQHQARFGLLLEEILHRLNKAESKQEVNDVRSH